MRIRKSKSFRIIKRETANMQRVSNLRMILDCDVKTPSANWTVRVLQYDLFAYIYSKFIAVFIAQNRWAFVSIWCLTRREKRAARKARDNEAEHARLHA